MSRRALPPARPTVAEVMKNAPGIARSLRRRGVPEADIEDVLQNVLMAAVTAIAEGRFHLDPLDPPRIMLRVWMLAIAKYRASSFVHTARFRRETLVLVADFPAVADIYPSPGAALSARSALQMLDRLPPAERELLSDLAAGWTAKEICARDGIGGSTIWGRITRARAKLLALIESERGEGDLRRARLLARLDLLAALRRRAARKR